MKPERQRDRITQLKGWERKQTGRKKLINLEKEIKEDIRNGISGNYNKYLLKQVHQYLLK